MNPAQRVLWGEGMFLCPQHLQRQDLYWDQRLQRVLGATGPQPWGLVTADFDVEALGSGLLCAERLELVFQDGTPCEAPGNDPLPPARNLAECRMGEGGAVAYACLPVLAPSGGNLQEEGRLATRTARYQGGSIQAADLYSDALESEIAVLRLQVRLVLDGESTDGCQRVPVCRVVGNPAGGWRLDGAFIPPLFQIGGSPWILGLLRRLLEMLELKSRTLSAMHGERARSIVAFGSADIASFWLLHTVNRAFPLLRDLLQQAVAHPHTLYQGLAQLCGELLTFSSTRSLQAIPPYLHQELTATFQGLEGLLRELLETVIPTGHVFIQLVNTRPSIHVGRIEAEHLLEGADFYLSVSSEAPAQQILEAVPLKLKVGSPDDVEKLLNSALAGVRLLHVAQPPAALPVRIGNHYFALEPAGPIYERMLRSRSVCVYAPTGLPGLGLELYAVCR